MKYIASFALLIFWFAGIVIAKGFWSTFFAIIVPFWAYYLTIEMLIIKFIGL